MDGRPVAVGLTPDAVDERWYTIAFGSSFTNPTFFADMQSTDGGDTAVMRHRNLAGGQVEVIVEEEQSANTEVDHTFETVGWMVIGE